MRLIVRTVENGARVALDKVELKRREAKEKILGTGFQYLEVEGTLGSLNALGQRIEERVYIIEDVLGAGYV